MRDSRKVACVRREVGAESARGIFWMGVGEGAGVEVGWEGLLGGVVVGGRGGDGGGGGDDGGGGGLSAFGTTVAGRAVRLMQDVPITETEGRERRGVMDGGRSEVGRVRKMSVPRVEDQAHV